MVRRILAVSLLLSFLVTVPNPAGPVQAVTDIDYTTILPQCANQTTAASSCWIPGDVDDSIGIVMTECTQSLTDNCYTATVNDKPAPANLRFLNYMTAWKTHTPTVENAQFESNIVAFYVPDGGVLNKGELWGWGKRPRDQVNGDGKVDLSAILRPTDTIRVTIKYRTPGVPNWSVLVAENGNMDFSLSGQSLTLTVEGRPATVAIESAAQHIDFDTERNDDPTLPWTGRCGIPNMKSVVCNVDKAESNPLLFYSRSSTFTNPPGSQSPAPIWVSTNATYFHQPSVETQADGTRFVQVKTAAPHFLADGTTLNRANVRFFVPNAILDTYKIKLTEAGMENGIGVMETKGKASRWLAINVKKTPIGALIELPPTSYSAPTLTVKPMQTSTALVGTKKFGSKKTFQYLAKDVARLAETKSTNISTVQLIKPDSGKECFYGGKGKSVTFQKSWLRMPTRIYHCTLNYEFKNGTRLKLKIITRRR